MHGYRLFDVAAALGMFLALRAVSYVGWIITRLDEDDGRDRGKRMISDATDLAESFLTSSRHTSFQQMEVSP